MSLNQLSLLLGLPDSDLQQVLEYASTLSKAEAVDHFKNLLGDSPQAVEFIAAFNSRRQEAASKTGPSSGQQTISEVEPAPKHQRQPRKKAAALHTPAARQVESVGPPPGTAYSKKAFEDEYMPERSSGASTPSVSHPISRASTPNLKSSTPPPSKSSKVPTPAGSLVSDLLAAPGPTSRSKSSPASRSSTPGPSARKNEAAAKISITGGMPMHGASTAVSDLDAAIRSLEITTNPSLSKQDDVAARRCNCVATRHPLQTAAPNCLNCGKVICVKEGLGPCTFCGAALLSPADVQAMIKELRAERGREKMAANREANRRPDVAATPRPFTKPRGEDDADISAAEAKAREHRDRLLGFQAQNARRTTVRDEAADFDVSSAMGSGGSIWATPEERAWELKRQQKLLREMEWNARPDYEKRKQVISIDLVRGKVVKKMMTVERPPSFEDEVDVDEDVGRAGVLENRVTNTRSNTGGTFSRNPLLGKLIKPVYDVKGKGVDLEGRRDRATRWRRVQDNLDDNEEIILDGGAYGARQEGLTGATVGDEPGCG